MKWSVSNDCNLLNHLLSHAEKIAPFLITNRVCQARLKKEDGKNDPIQTQPIISGKTNTSVRHVFGGPCLCCLYTFSAFLAYHCWGQTPPPRCLGTAPATEVLTNVFCWLDAFPQLTFLYPPLLHSNANAQTRLPMINHLSTNLLWYFDNCLIVQHCTQIDFI